MTDLLLVIVSAFQVVLVCVSIYNTIISSSSSTRDLFVHYSGFCFYFFHGAVLFVDTAGMLV